MNARHLTFLKSDCGPPENFASGAWANWLNGRLAPISVSTPAFGNRRLPLQSRCPFAVSERSRGSGKKRPSTIRQRGAITQKNQATANC